MKEKLLMRIGIVLCIAFGMLLIFGVIPFVVILVTTPRIINVDTNSQWISFWGNYLGAIIGGAISGCITLYVMIKTLDDGKKERKLSFCNGIVGSCTEVLNDAMQITLTSQKFLQSAQEKYQADVTWRKNKILSDIWVVITELEAKRDSYAFAREIYQDLVTISEYINSFSINDLNYTDERATENVVQSLVQSREYKNVEKKCFLAAQGLEKINQVLSEHLKSFYNENTKKIL